MAAYLRVSTLRQQEDGYGLQGQERAIRSWAGRHGVVIVAVFCDAGVPGVMDRAQRPQLSAAFELLTNRSVDGLVVARLDRLARALTVQEAILASIWATGAVVCTADDGLILQDDPTDPMRTAMRQMMGVFAQLERSMGRHRLRQAKIAMKAKGLHADGHYQFGWRRGGKDPREQRVLRIGRKLHRDGLTWSEVAAVLNDKGARYAPRDGVWTGARAWSLLRPKPTPPEKARRWAANPPPVRGRTERRAPPRPVTWLSTGQAAAILGISNEFVLRQAAHGQLPYVMYRHQHVFDVGAVAVVAARERQLEAGWLPARNAAEAFNVDVHTVRRWVKEGRVPGRIDKRGRICVPRDELLDHIPKRVVTIGSGLRAPVRSRPLVTARTSADSGYAHVDGATLRLARLVAGLTQTQLAERIGLATAGTIRLWEHELSRPRPGYLSRIARAVNVEIDQLLKPISQPSLHALRLARGLTMAQVAQRGGFAATTYYRLEHGLRTRQPDRRTIAALARVLKVRKVVVTDLITSVERKRTDPARPDLAFPSVALPPRDAFRNEDVAEGGVGAAEPVPDPDH